MPKNDRVDVDFGDHIVISAECCDAHGCVKPGSLSYNTRGGGPWYCRDHFKWHDGPAIAPPAPVDPDVERQVALEIPKTADGFGTWWARRILRLVELGQVMPSKSVEMAREALGLSTQREPGEEG